MMPEYLLNNACISSPMCRVCVCVGGGGGGRGGAGVYVCVCGGVMGGGGATPCCKVLCLHSGFWGEHCEQYGTPFGLFMLAVPQSAFQVPVG